jgi:hypothetical protein
MLAGVIVEFWVFGGLAGDPAGAIVGWMIYLLAGVVVHIIGLALYGQGRRGVLGALAFAIAALHVLWFAAVLSGVDALLALDQLLIGLGWVAVGSIGIAQPSALEVERDNGAVR